MVPTNLVPAVNLLRPKGDGWAPKAEDASPMVVWESRCGRRRGGARPRAGRGGPPAAAGRAATRAARAGPPEALGSPTPPMRPLKTQPTPYPNPTRPQRDILMALEERFPDAPKLLPADAAQRAEVRAARGPRRAPRLVALPSSRPAQPTAS
jgi:hypothetical protein